MNDYPHLFTPVKVGDVLFRNRIFASATGHLDIKADKTLSDGALMYYERKAAGGASQVCVGEMSVDPIRGSRGGLVVDLTDFGSMRYLNKLTDYVTRHGSVASAELQHAGMYGSMGLGPSDGEVGGKPCRAMTEQEIQETITAYANAAAMAQRCGFGMVTVHGGHGWLPQQFFSRFYNDRTDDWGGSVENRARLAVAICDAIHEKCGRGFPVEMRISATEFDLGYGPEEGIEYAKQLDGHADIIHVSVGVHGTLSSDTWMKMSPTMFDEDGVNVKYAAEIKKHVTKSFVATVGALSDPAMMEEIIASGKADFVAVARALLCDPDLPNKARRGDTVLIRKCIRCMGCWSNLMSGQIVCALNPETSREYETKFALPTAEKKTVLVAGGGIAGMQAAITAADNGHDVILCEKSSRLGGAIRCEEHVPFKKHVEEYIQLQERIIGRSAIDLRLNTAVTPELARQLRPDVLISAIGSVAITPPIPGIDGDNVLSAEFAYSNPELVGAKAVIIGAGLVGTELAIFLSILGRDVELIEIKNRITADGNGTHGSAIMGQLRDREIPARFGTNVLAIDSEGVLFENADGQSRVNADTIIYATGQKALTAEAFALGECAPEFHMIGDCITPKNILQAVKTAYTVARDIGRY